MGGKAGHADNREEFDGTLELLSDLSPQVRQLPDDLPYQIDELLKRALSLDSRRRFGTMRAFANALDRIFKQIESTRVPLTEIPRHPREIAANASFLKRLFGG